MPKYEGGCLCKAVRFICDADPISQSACHCRDCQFLSGGGAAHHIVLPTESVHLTKGAPAVYASLSDAGNRVSRNFCGECGTHLFSRNAIHADRTSVNAGVLDDISLYQPHGHTWVKSAPRWHRLEADLSRLLREVA